MFKFEYDYMRLSAISIICVAILLAGCLLNNYLIVSKYIDNGYQKNMVVGNEYSIWQKCK